MDEPMKTDQPVEDQFLKAMGLPDMDQERKQKLLGKILRVLDFNVLQRLAKDLNDQQMEELTNLLEPEELDEDKIQAWFKQNVPNYSQIIEDEAQKMKQQQDDILDKVMGS